MSFSQINEILPPNFIKTITFKGSTSQAQLPILRLGEPFSLEFDALTGNEEDLYYKIEHKLYKVPTYGKIYKIIDFGRAIYIYDNQIFCSDAFNRGEDADTQYNCEPFFNDAKPRIEPNYSFDLYLG